MLSARNRRRLARQGKVKHNDGPPDEPRGLSHVPLLYQPTDYRGPLYLYLAEDWMADNWIKGGRVPIKTARDYLSAERIGTLTPDEVVQQKIRLADESSINSFSLAFGGTQGRFTFKNVAVLTRQHGHQRLDGHISLYEEDAHILCFSTVRSRAQMERFKKAACVEILDVDRLKTVLDSQIQQHSFSGLVGYTDTNDRGHFMKSKADSWQAEYRITWLSRGLGVIECDLPPGIAKHVNDL